MRAFHKSGQVACWISTFSRGLHRGKPDADLHDWNVRSGKFDVLVGGSSRDLPLKETIRSSDDGDRLSEADENLHAEGLPESRVLL